MTSVEFQHPHLLLNGQPTVLKSGELHPARIPVNRWPLVLDQCLALGLNCISIYTFWNIHEPTEGQFNFTGRNNIAHFCALCAERGLHVILRPGPYVCAEWDGGGLPHWLWTKTTRLRTDDPAFLAPTERYLAALHAHLKPHFAPVGGPIILVQLENEFGSYPTYHIPQPDRDTLESALAAAPPSQFESIITDHGYGPLLADAHRYLSALEAILRRTGVTVPLFTSDGPTHLMLTFGTLPHIAATINFATNAPDRFAVFDRIRPNAFRMNAENWCGWFDHWGKPHHTRPAEDTLDCIRFFQKNQISFNLYMACGGTTPGFYTGANGHAYEYAPDTNSYDYDAPISEDFSMSPKGEAIRNLINPNGIPAPMSAPPLPEFTLTANPTGVQPFGEQAGVHPLNPSLGAQGILLYQTTLPEPGLLALPGLRDFAVIHTADGQTHTVIRPSHEPIPVPAGPLKIVVASLGRINYDTHMPLEGPKGLLETPTFNGQTLTTTWLTSVLATDIHPPQPGPETSVTLRTQLLPETDQDAWLLHPNNDHPHFACVWLGQTPLGRLWSAGPQSRLFTPAEERPRITTLALLDLFPIKT